MSFFRGMYINMIANCVANMIFFTIYADGKKRYNYSREHSTLAETTFISMRAGFLTMLITNPIWVIKVRTMLYLNDKALKESGMTLLKKTVHNMYKEEGTPAFFRGFPIAVFLSIYGMISMSIYETTLQIAGYTERNKGEKSRLIPFIAGGVSKCSTSVIFYPFNVIKTR